MGISNHLPTASHWLENKNRNKKAALQLHTTKLDLYTSKLMKAEECRK